MKNLLEGRLEFYKDINNKLGQEILVLEIEELEKHKFPNVDTVFKNCYSRPGKANFFKKSICIFDFISPFNFIFIQFKKLILDKFALSLYFQYLKLIF